MDPARPEDHYDFIIVGAGTAGCVLANRLSADRDARVCLIEAGGADDDLFIHIPAAVAAAIRNPKLGWGFFTAPQASAADRRIPLPRGRVIGGSSSINGMAYMRGHPRDFDDWAGRYGATGWSYAEVLPYFMRSEHNEAWPDSPYHGTGGPMNVKDIPRNNPLIKRFLQATESLQFRRCADFNAGDPEGFGPRQATIRNGRRVSMATAFLDPARGRANLTVLKNTLAERVTIVDRRATGVQVVVDGVRRQLSARREIVLSAGSYCSPQLLMLSGIGDAAALAALDIEVKYDLPPVGRTLGDHPAAAIAMRTRNPESYGLSWRALPRDLWNILEYALFRRGPLASNLLEAHGFLRSTPETERPDVQLVFIPAHRNASGFPIPFGHGYGVLSINIRPRSRGAVTLASPDPRAAPVIDPKLFDDPADVETVLRGLLIGRRVLASTAFAPCQADEILPGAAVQDADRWRDYIRRTVVTVHHPSGTCRMGIGPDAVVDPQLRVIGMEGLRVADASVFPDLIAGNTNAAVVMVAEKAADLIRGRPAPAPIDLPH